MNLFSPEPIVHQNMMAIMSKGTNVEVFDPALQTTIPKHVTITYFNEFNKRVDGRPAVDIPGEQIMRGITADQVLNLYQFQSLIGNCVANAEAINRRLAGVLQNIQAKQLKTEDLSELSFMQLRDKLSEILKSHKRLEGLEELATNGKVKAFTKLFFRYITDRNIYTHGDLSLDIYGDRIVIHAKVDGKAIYYKVDREIIISHLNCYKDLSTILSKLDVYFRNNA